MRTHPFIPPLDALPPLMHFHRFLVCVVHLVHTWVVHDDVHSPTLATLGLSHPLEVLPQALELVYNQGMRGGRSCQKSRMKSYKITKGKCGGRFRQRSEDERYRLKSKANANRVRARIESQLQFKCRTHPSYTCMPTEALKNCPTSCFHSC
jgi:hypothetical protein